MSDRRLVFTDDDAGAYTGSIGYTATYDDGTWIKGIPGGHKIAPSPAIVALIRAIGAEWERGKEQQAG